MIIDDLKSLLIIHNKSSRFKDHTINVLLTNQSQVHPKGVMKARVRGAQSHIARNCTVGPGYVG